MPSPPASLGNDLRRTLGLRAWRAAAVTAPLVLLLCVPISTAAAPPAEWEGAGVSWSNGVVLCQFAPSLPTVSVSALARAETGLTAALGSISEMSPSNTALATANLSSTSWTVTNLSNDDEYDLSYSVVAPVSTVESPATSVGTVEVRVDFVLPAYEESPSASTDEVAVELLISHWPWQATVDHLAVAMSAAPSYPAQEHLVLGTAPSMLVSSVATSTGAVFEELMGAANGTANPGPSGSTNVSVQAGVAGNSSWATVSLSFGAVAGAFSSLSYTASVEVFFPSEVAGIPLVDFLVVGSAATIVAVLVAAGTVRVRRRPSDLTYVNEEEP